MSSVFFVYQRLEFQSYPTKEANHGKIHMLGDWLNSRFLKWGSDSFKIHLIINLNKLAPKPFYKEN